MRERLETGRASRLRGTVEAPSADARLLLYPAGSTELERPTEPPDLIQADEGAAERGEGEMDVGPAFVAHGQVPEPPQPGQGAFNDPPVSAQLLAAFNPAPGDTRRDATLAALAAATPVVIGLVGVQLGRASSRTAPLPSAGIPHAAHAEP